MTIENALTTTNRISGACVTAAFLKIFKIYIIILIKHAKSLFMKIIKHSCAMIFKIIN